MGYKLFVRVREKGLKGPDRNLYKNEVNLNDANLLVILFEDLISLFNIPFWKAVKIMEGKSRTEIFPFSP